MAHVTSAVRAPIDADRLSQQQYDGVACVRCGHRFTIKDRPTEVARIGRDCHALRACPACAPLVIAPPPWPAFGSA